MESPVANPRTARWQTYLFAFVITAALFATAFYVSTFFNNQRIAEIRDTQDDISTDILSLETQFDLLQERSCQDITENSIQPASLRQLASQLSYMEAQNSSPTEVTRLKRLYSLMEIKDYLLMKQISAKCNLKPVFILYFYSNKGDCRDCESQGYVLTSLAEQYPQVRIYSFDYNLDVTGLQTLIDVEGVQNRLPALVINGDTYYGLQNVSDIEKILPQLASLKQGTSTPATKTR